MDDREPGGISVAFDFLLSLTEAALTIRDVTPSFGVEFVRGLPRAARGRRLPPVSL
jgi:hypothetical protein